MRDTTRTGPFVDLYIEQRSGILHAIQIPRRVKSAGGGKPFARVRAPLLQKEVLHVYTAKQWILE